MCSVGFIGASLFLFRASQSRLESGWFMMTSMMLLEKAFSGLIMKGVLKAVPMAIGLPMIEVEKSVSYGQFSLNSRSHQLRFHRHDFIGISRAPGVYLSINALLILDPLIDVPNEERSSATPHFLQVSASPSKPGPALGEALGEALRELAQKMNSNLSKSPQPSCQDGLGTSCNSHDTMGRCCTASGQPARVRQNLCQFVIWYLTRSECVRSYVSTGASHVNLFLVGQLGSKEEFGI